MTLEFEFDGHEMIIEDPMSSRSWLTGLAPFINDFAQDKYGLRFEHIDHDLSKEKLRELADAVGQALAQYRKDALEAISTNTPHTQWKDVLGDALALALNGENCEHTEHDHALYEDTDFTDLYEAIDQAMQEHDGPVADLDELFDEVRSATREKMEGHDWSTVFDAIGKLRIPLLFVPGYRPGKDALSDFDISAEEIQECKHPGRGEQALLNLLRVSIPDFMEYKGFDHRNSDLMDAWISDIKDPTLDPAISALGPVFKDLTELDDFFDNATGNGGVLPCWVGTLTPNDLKAIDPLTDNALTGGMISLNEWQNGSGSVEGLGESVVLLSGDWLLSSEHGKAIEDTCGLTKKSLEGKIAPVPEVKVAKEPEALEFSL